MVSKGWFAKSEDLQMTNTALLFIALLICHVHLYQGGFVFGMDAVKNIGSHKSDIMLFICSTCGKIISIDTGDASVLEKSLEIWEHNKDRVRKIMKKV